MILKKKKELLILFWYKEKTCASTHTLQSKVAHKTITQINATVHVNANIICPEHSSSLSYCRHAVTKIIYRHSHGYLYITIYEFNAIDSVLPRSSYGHDAIRAPSPSPNNHEKSD
jgi:dolichyl-phosphate-mannose--protein O-mannosyl transferase